MSGAERALVREVVRDVLSELLPDLVADARGASQSPAAGSAASMPPVPVAAVHRPAGWRSGEATGARGESRVEEVSLTSDTELAAFVQGLLQRSESPQERAALRSGAVRFTLRAGGASRGGGPARRIEHGAVTERLVRETAAAGGSLVLGPRAVLTPLARDVARTLGVTIEKEKRC